MSQNNKTIIVQQMVQNNKTIIVQQMVQNNKTIIVETDGPKQYNYYSRN